MPVSRKLRAIAGWQGRQADTCAMAAGAAASPTAKEAYRQSRGYFLLGIADPDGPASYKVGGMSTSRRSVDRLAKFAGGRAPGPAFVARVIRGRCRTQLYLRLLNGDRRKNS